MNEPDPDTLATTRKARDARDARIRASRAAVVNGPQQLPPQAYNNGVVPSSRVTTVRRSTQSQSVRRDASHDEPPRPPKRPRLTAAAQALAAQQAQLQGIAERAERNERITREALEQNAALLRMITARDEAPSQPSPPPTTPQSSTLRPYTDFAMASEFQAPPSNQALAQQWAPYASSPLARQVTPAGNNPFSRPSAPVVQQNSWHFNFGSQR